MRKAISMQLRLDSKPIGSVQLNTDKTISIETYADESAAVMKNAAERKQPFLLVINYADAQRSFVGKVEARFSNPPGHCPNCNISVDRLRHATLA